MDVDIFLQRGYRCRMDWGRHGTRRAAGRGDILVIVDTLSFSTSVATAIAHGAVIYPCSKDADVDALADRWQAEPAVNRRDVPQRGNYSLSPQTYFGIPTGTAVLLPSPNGATCARYAADVPYLIVGALVNAAAVASAVSFLLESTRLSVTVIACGERWEEPNEDGELRFAIEDYLGAGSILSFLSHLKSPEARTCQGAFLALRDQLPEIIRESGSGRELRTRGFNGDVEHAAKLNLYDVVPIMRGDRLEQM